MKTSGITAALPAQDLGRAKAFYVEKVGLHVTDVRAAVEEMRGRGVEFEEYDTPETRTENGVARMPGGGEAAWFKDSEGNLVGVVPA
jgi:predicted enzyme related to lactoylglutathione lyase